MFQWYNEVVLHILLTIKLSIKYYIAYPNIDQIKIIDWYLIIKNNNNTL